MRLIDADALREVLKSRTIQVNGFTLPLPLLWEASIVAVDMQPTIDADPVRHSRWVAMDRIASGFPWKLRCNRCGVPQDYPHTYCPNCGAKMDAKEEKQG